MSGTDERCNQWNHESLCKCQNKHQPERGEVAEALGLSSACCRSCGINFDKYDYAFFRIGRLRSEVELAIRLLKQGVTAERVIRELEQVLMDTMSDYRPPERKPR